MCLGGPALFKLHYQSLILTSQDCRSVSWLKQWRFLKLLEESWLMLTRLEKGYKSLSSTSRLLGRLCTKRELLLPLLPTPQEWSRNIITPRARLVIVRSQESRRSSRKSQQVALYIIIMCYFFQNSNRDGFENAF